MKYDHGTNVSPCLQWMEDSWNMSKNNFAQLQDSENANGENHTHAGSTFQNCLQIALDENWENYLDLFRTGQNGCMPTK